MKTLKVVIIGYGLVGLALLHQAKDAIVGKLNKRKSDDRIPSVGA